MASIDRPRWPARIGWSIVAGLLLSICTAAAGDEWFAPAARVADYRPKGPTHCFRQFNVDWSWIATKPAQVAEFLSQADPEAFAAFCAQTHIDGTVVMAVPHHGYCTYPSRVGTQFPGMQGDWFGATIDALHRRRIAAFGYVTLNWNWKFIREHLGSDFIHGQPDADGVCGSRCTICLNAPGYLDLVAAYTREVLENYAVDGMRWDILQTAPRCRCAGCRALYREIYHEELVDWSRVDPRRARELYLNTTSRAVLRLRTLCKQIKPTVEIWQNGLQSYTPNDLDLGRRMDIAYNEYGDPFRLLLIRGVTGKAAAINGLMNHAPSDPPAALDHAAWRTCLALGGRCYSYYGHKQTDPRTVLPGPAMRAWHREQLAPFYEMVGRIEPWLEGAEPVAHVGIVFCEATRYRFADLDRKPYIEPMEKLTQAYLARSVPLAFVNGRDLERPPAPLARFRLLVLPQTTGLSADELQALRQYVTEGGRLLVAGDALRYDERGLPRREFALAREMGVAFVRTAAAGAALAIRGQLPDGPLAADLSVGNVVEVRSTSGQTVLEAVRGDARLPLLHVADLGRGKIAYLAALDCVPLTCRAIDWLAGRPPLSVEDGDGRGDGPRVVLTHQPRQKRWILHLIGDGDYTVDLSRRDVPATRITATFPTEGWSCRVEATVDGLRVRVAGAAHDRLIVLE